MNSIRFYHDNITICCTEYDADANTFHVIMECDLWAEDQLDLGHQGADGQDIQDGADHFGASGKRPVKSASYNLKNNEGIKKHPGK